MLGEPRVYTLRLDREHATTWFGEGTSLTCQVDDLRWTTRQGYVPNKSKQIKGEGCRRRTRAGEEGRGSASPAKRNVKDDIQLFFLVNLEL